MGAYIVKDSTCQVCNRDSKRMNNDFAECSHITCPVRRNSWSERPSEKELFKGPWPKHVDADPMPMDVALNQARLSGRI
jgi:hypothetical protein